MGDLKQLNAAEYRRDIEIEVDLGDGTCVKARKLDMTLMVFEGVVPMPMLVAVQRMIEMPNATPVQRVEALGVDQGRSMVGLLQKHAVVVTINPKLTMEETEDQNTLPVKYLNIAQLMAIWSATAVVPRFGPSQAAEFRGAARDDDAPAAPVGEVVQPPTELVADGRSVEYLGQ